MTPEFHKIKYHSFKQVRFQKIQTEWTNKIEGAIERARERENKYH